MSETAVAAARDAINAVIIRDGFCSSSMDMAADAIAKYEAALWVDYDKMPDEWRDGRKVLIEVVHPHAQYADDPIEEGYIAVYQAHWIDHNGGGWTWHGMLGSVRRVRLMPAPPPIDSHPAP